MKPRLLIALVLLLGAGGAGYYLLGDAAAAREYRTEAAALGVVERVVRATGTITPLQTVKVGSQVSGTVATLHADFNSTVVRGQVIAVIDSTFLSASVREAEANLQRSRAQLNEAERTLGRTRELYAKDLVSQADLDAALTAYETGLAQSRQSEAALERARVNLRYAVIRSPIDGIVISRDVDVGQTVAASLSAPQLFAIANDLERMQVEASVDEADIGQIAPGQTAAFTVDAYPDEEFEGTVSQVRLSPITVQNVVTYTVIIEVANPGRRLRPGMTATASIRVDRRDDVLRIPAVALRFQPPEDVLAASRREAAGDSGRGPVSGAGPTAMRMERGSGGEREEEGGRPRWRRGVGTDTAQPGRPGGGAARGGRGGGRGGSAAAERRGRPASVWVLGDDGRLSRVGIRTGLSDQRYVEVLRGGLREGDKVVLGMLNADRPSAGRSNNPLQPTMVGGGRRSP